MSDSILSSTAILVFMVAICKIVIDLVFTALAVSYTHLDVYKRQNIGLTFIKPPSDNVPN